MAKVPHHSDPVPTKQCVECGAEFQPLGGWRYASRITCSVECRRKRNNRLSMESQRNASRYKRPPVVKKSAPACSPTLAPVTGPVPEHLKSRIAAKMFNHSLGFNAVFE